MITLTPIGVVRGGRDEVRDDYWGDSSAAIELREDLPAESLDGLEEFSHAEIIFLFDRLDEDGVVAGARRPRGNPAWPCVGIFAQRGKARPNRLGATIARVDEGLMEESQNLEVTSKF